MARLGCCMNHQKSACSAEAHAALTLLRDARGLRLCGLFRLLLLLCFLGRHVYSALICNNAAGKQSTVQSQVRLLHGTDPPSRCGSGG